MNMSGRSLAVHRSSDLGTLNTPASNCERYGLSNQHQKGSLFYYRTSAHISVNPTMVKAIFCGDGLVARGSSIGQGRAEEAARYIKQVIRMPL